MAQNQVNMPAGFGGLTNYKEEYASKINLKPTHIILFVFLIILLRVGLGVFYS